MAHSFHATCSSCEAFTNILMKFTATLHLPFCRSVIIQKRLIISTLLLQFSAKKIKPIERRRFFHTDCQSTLITAAFTMLGRFCRLSPIINISIKCLSVKLILTVGSVPHLVSTYLLCPYKFSTITCQGFFFFSKTRNYSCLLSSLSSWHHSSIIQFLIQLFEVCSFIW